MWSFLMVNLGHVYKSASGAGPVQPLDSMVQQSQNHKNTGCCWRQLWGLSGPTPCSSRATQSQLPSAVSKRLLSMSKVGDSTTSLGTLCQSSVTLTGKKCFLMCRGNLLCSGLCPWPLVLPLGTTGKSQALSFSHFLILLSFLCSRLDSPSSHSLSLHEKCSSPLFIRVALCWTHSSMSMSLLYWGAQHWAQWACNGHRLPVMPGSSQCTNAEVGWCHPGGFTSPCYTWPFEPSPLSPTSSSRKAFRAFIFQKGLQELQAALVQAQA